MIRIINKKKKRVGGEANSQDSIGLITNCLMEPSVYIQHVCYELKSFIRRNEISL